MCTDEVIDLLNLYIEGTLELAADHDPLHLSTLEALRDDALLEINRESDETLNTDRALLELRKLFETSHDAVTKFYQNEAWDEMIDAATALLTARDELAAQMQEVTA